LPPSFPLFFKAIPVVEVPLDKGYVKLVVELKNDLDSFIELLQYWTQYDFVCSWRWGSLKKKDKDILDKQRNETKEEQTLEQNESAKLTLQRTKIKGTTMKMLGTSNQKPFKIPLMISCSNKQPSTLHAFSVLFCKSLFILLFYE